MDPSNLEKQQEQALASINEVLARAEQRIVALDPNLKPEILQQRTAAIREETMEALRPRRQAMAERAHQARQLMRRHTPDAVRRAALDAMDGTTRLATFAVLSRSSIGELVDRLQDAVDRGDVATAEATRLEFASRDADDRRTVSERFNSIFGQLSIPQAETATRALGRAHGLLQMADVKLSQLSTGQSDPMARLAAHRAAGTPRAA